jgi:hypothetical protein
MYPADWLSPSVLLPRGASQDLFEKLEKLGFTIALEDQNHRLGWSHMTRYQGHGKENPTGWYTTCTFSYNKDQWFFDLRTKTNRGFRFVFLKTNENLVPVQVEVVGFVGDED